MRYRLIPTQGQQDFIHFEEPTHADAIRVAEIHSYRLGCPVVVCEAPEGGLVRQVGVVGEAPESTNRRR